MTILYKRALSFSVPREYTALRKEVGRMLDLLDLYDGTEREESTADTPDEVEFACVYFTYYPYLYANS